MKGVNDDELQHFVSMTEDTPLDVRFIEIMPFHGNGWDPKQVMCYQEAMKLLEHGHGVRLVPILLSGEERKPENDEIYAKGYGHIDRFDVHDTTKWFRASHSLGSGSASGRVGFITTMSSPFCGGCNRRRITANMRLKVCLFGEEEADLLSVMRRNTHCNAEVESVIEKAVWAKHPSLGGHKAPDVLVNKENRAMIMIGG